MGELIEGLRAALAESSYTLEQAATEFFADPRVLRVCRGVPPAPSERTISTRPPSTRPLFRLSRTRACRSPGSNAVGIDKLIRILFVVQSVAYRPDRHTGE
jgi:hypothetical protein